MEMLLLLLIIIILLVALVSRSTKGQPWLELQSQVELLRQEINFLRKEIAKIPKGPELSTLPETIPSTPKTPKPAPDAPVIQTVPPFVRDSNTQPAQEAAYTLHASENGWQRWLSRNPDLEKFIGENLVNKIGIAVLVLGIGFFVKYAIDKNWIQEGGRIVIGLFCGMLLVGLAHRLRSLYRSFSSVLAGGGLTVFYFTVAIAFHQYQLIGQWLAFASMIIITSFAVLLSILYNRIELAILAAIGGFITPFLVSTGQQNYIALFVYLALLNTGLIVLAFYRSWPAVQVIAFLFTLLIMGGWTITTSFDSAAVPWLAGLLFAGLFYFQFQAMLLINQRRKPGQFSKGSFSIWVAATAAFYAEGMYFLQNAEPVRWQGFFTLIVACINLAYALGFYKKMHYDRRFVYLLIGLGISFLSLAIPVQLEGNFITLFWSAEALFLYWFYQQTRINLVKWSSCLVWVLAYCSMAIDWGQLYNYDSAPMPVIVNKAFVTGLFLLLCTAGFYRLLKREPETSFASNSRVSTIRSIVAVAGLILLLFLGSLEINFQFSKRMPDTAFAALYLQLYYCSFVWAFFKFARLPQTARNVYLQLTISILLWLVYLGFTPVLYALLLQLLSQQQHLLLFQGHWLAVIFLFAILGGLIRLMRNSIPKVFNSGSGFTWIAGIAAISLISLECRNLFLMFSNGSADAQHWFENLYYRAGISIVWSICSFVLIWMGLRLKYKPVRIMAFVLFGVTLVKLFVYDIRNVPAGGKIMAFILLGILLLTVSFMYQRLKKILIDDLPEKN